MASHTFDPKTSKSRIFFRYGGRQFNRIVLANNSREAERLCALVEVTIQDLERGKLVMPPTPTRSPSCSPPATTRES
jgi:hypothetical protein